MIMQYRKDKNGNEISVLGYGCMRFTKEGGHADIDKAEKEVMAAIDAGVNYLDTAYVYAGNEAAVGEILARNHCRERIYLATKLPHYLIKSVEGAQKMFEEELRRLQTDYIDYYLMHMLTDLPTWEKLKKLGMEDWIREKKASGEIRNIGFSYHGRSDMFMQLIDAYDWDFCQIQYNYMDEHSQAGVEGLRYAHAKGIPVIIMEPLRGGRLVNLLPESAKELFAQDEEHRTPAELALKWLYDQPEVTCVLSGMNSMEMVEQNVRTASEYGVGCMTESDRALVEAVRQEITKHVKVGCTGCGYCMPCPRGVDIPGTFRCYNAMYSEGKKSGRRDYLQCTAFRKNPASASQCVGCGKCQKACPIFAIEVKETEEGQVKKKTAQVNSEICLGCGVCARNCPTKAIEMKRRPIQVITPVNGTHRFVLQAIEKGTLQNLIFDNQAFANHRAMAAVFATILKLPPLKQALASKQFKSVYLDKLISSQIEKNRRKEEAMKK